MTELLRKYHTVFSAVQAPANPTLNFPHFHECPVTTSLPLEDSLFIAHPQ